MLEIKKYMDIIRYGKDNGYTFEVITSNTPRVVHRVNN